MNESWMRQASARPMYDIGQGAWCNYAVFRLQDPELSAAERYSINRDDLERHGGAAHHALRRQRAEAQTLYSPEIIPE